MPVPLHVRAQSAAFFQDDDDETTPPPGPPPDQHTLEQMSLHDQVAALRAVAAANASGIERVWNARHVAERLERVEAKIDSVSQWSVQHSAQISEFLMPAIKTQMASVQTLIMQSERTSIRLEVFFESEWPRHQATIGDLVDSIKDVVQRIGRLEHSHAQLVDGVAAVVGRAASASDGHNALALRVTFIERQTADAALVVKAGDAREAKLFTKARVIFVSVAAVVSFVASQLADIVEWIRK